MNKITQLKNAIAQAETEVTESTTRSEYTEARSKLKFLEETLHEIYYSYR